MIHNNDDYVHELVGMLLQEESRLVQEITCQAAQNPAPSPVVTNTLALNVNRSQRPTSNSNFSSSSDHGNRSNNNRKHSRPQCQLCNKPGHEAIDCWQRTNKIDYPSRRPNPRSNSHQANFVQNHSPSSVTDPSWYFDTGATDHVTPDIQILQITKPYNGTDKLQVGNGNDLHISHLSSSYLHKISLPSVLVVPLLTKNLISVSRLTSDNNVYMEFWSSHCIVKSLQGTHTPSRGC